MCADKGLVSAYLPFRLPPGCQREEEEEKEKETEEGMWVEKAFTNKTSELRAHINTN